MAVSLKVKLDAHNLPELMRMSIEYLAPRHPFNRGRRPPTSESPDVHGVLGCHISA